MGLLTAGYWPTTYWPEDYWVDDYWPDYGTAAPPTISGVYGILYDRPSTYTRTSDKPITHSRTIDN